MQGKQKINKHYIYNIVKGDSIKLDILKEKLKLRKEKERIEREKEHLKEAEVVLKKEVEENKEKVKVLGEKFRNAQKQIQEERKQFKKTALTMITAALAFVAGLFWRDAISSGIEIFLPPTKGFQGRLASALIVTIIAVFAINLLTKWGSEWKGPE